VRSCTGNNPSPRIRQARLRDLRSLLKIEQLSFPSPWSFLCFFTELVNPASHLLVAGPRPPQAWRTWGYTSFWVVAQEMHIMNLAVHPLFRRRGVARALLVEALRRSRALAAEVAWLEVRPSNDAALALYESLGFKEVGRRSRYYQDNLEDALLLAFYWEENHVEGA